MQWGAGKLDLSGPRKGAEDAPDEYEPWVRTLFPKYVRHPFADRHHAFWEFIWEVRPGSMHPALVAVFPRGGGKTTTAELGLASIGVRGMRRYAWYVTETQDKANTNVQNIGALLESPQVERYYPAHAERMLTKYGHSKGWTSQRLRTAGGFTVDGIGLDTAQRGLKIEDQRPDIIILDDVDGAHDSLATTAKKIDTITKSILPAGSSNCVVVAVQNLIIPDGVFTRMTDGRADYLSDRVLLGPYPAVEGFAYEFREQSDGVRQAVITKGRATWPGQSLEDCQALINRIGLTAFEKECQHLVKDRAEGLVLGEFDGHANMQQWKDEELLEGIATGKLVPFAGIDYGYWRFAFLLMVINRAGVVHVIDEYFSQGATLGTRAEAIDALLRKYGIGNLKVYDDPANPQDRLEFNKALKRGWSRNGQAVNPKWRAGAAVKGKGSRTAGPERINDMFQRRALLVRRGIGGKHRWHLGRNASSSGTEIVGSRFLWEMGAWKYPDPKEGDAQKQDPDDNTADGADLMAAFRYGLMSRLMGSGFDKPEKKKDRNRDYGMEKMAEAARRLADQHGLRRGA